MRSLLPSVNDYREFRHSWPKDLLAGVTVGIVALPLALAFAISSGATPEMGIITAVIAGFVAAVFGGSNVQVSGPTGAMVVVLAPIAALYGPAALPLVAILAGIIVMIGGVLRIGRAVSFIPWPVIEGFTLGIGMIIFLQQVPTALGTVPGKSDNSLIAAVKSFATVSWPAVGWALLAALTVVFIMTLTKKLSPLIPGSIIGIIVVTVAVELLDLPLARIGELPQSLPAPSLPPMNIDLIVTLGPSIVAVAALAAIESLLAARVASGMTDAGRYDGDREMFGQGLASIASGLFGGMPATGAIARTAVNVRSGARTRAAAAFHAVFLAGIVLLAADVVSRIPLVALAGVLLATAINMMDFHTGKQIIKTSRSDATIYILTALVTVLFDLIVAVGIGIGITAFFVLRAISNMSRVSRQAIPGPAHEHDDRIVIMRLEGAMFFGVGDRLANELEDVRNTSVVILKLSRLALMDSSGAHVISELVTLLNRRGVHVVVKGLQHRHERVASGGGMTESIGYENMFHSMDEALARARELVAEDLAEKAARVAS